MLTITVVADGFQSQTEVGPARRSGRLIIELPKKVKPPSVGPSKTEQPLSMSGRTRALPPPRSITQQSSGDCSPNIVGTNIVNTCAAPKDHYTLNDAAYSELPKAISAQPKSVLAEGPVNVSAEIADSDSQSFAYRLEDILGGTNLLGTANNAYSLFTFGIPKHQGITIVNVQPGNKQLAAFLEKTLKHFTSTKITVIDAASTNSQPLEIVIRPFS